MYMNSNKKKTKRITSQNIYIANIKEHVQPHIKYKKIFALVDEDDDNDDDDEWMRIKLTQQKGLIVVYFLSLDNHENDST